MAALARLSQSPRTTTSTAKEPASPGAGAIAKLAKLHAEAIETARLANLLGGSLTVAVMLPALASFTIALTWGAGFFEQLIWFVFVATVSIAMGRSYLRAIAKPFDRVALKSFAKDMSAILLYAGFAWGSGAYLALPPGTGVFLSVLFVVAPAMTIAFFLHEREAVFLFLVPVALLVSFASVLRPFEDGTLGAGLILIACAGVAGLAMLRDQRRIGDFVKPAMLPLT